MGRTIFFGAWARWVFSFFAPTVPFRAGRKVLWLVCLAIFVCCGLSGFYFFPHYFVLMLPAMGLLVGAGCTLVRQKLRRSRLGPLGAFLPAAVFLARLRDGDLKARAVLIGLILSNRMWLSIAAPAVGPLHQQPFVAGQPCRRLSVPNRKSIFTLIATPLRAISTCMILPPPPRMRLQ